MSRIALSLRLLRIEMIITSTMAAMTIMVPFYYSIGMSQAQVGLSQALFTVVLLVLNLPTGWLADRFSRKLCNALGDAIAAGGFVYYAFAQSFFDVIVGEVVIGIGMALTHGVDGALLRAYTQALGRSDANLHKQTASINSWRPIAQIAALLIGGYIGSYEPRLAILLSALPYAIGAALSLSLQEAGERLVSKHRNPFRDMAWLVTDSVGRDPRLRWLIIAHAVGREMTHPIIWALTPLLILAGVPAQIVAIGWVLNSLAIALGSRLAGRWALCLSEWQRFLLPILVACIALCVMAIHLSLATIWLYACMGLAQGWMSAVTMPMIQVHTAPDRQATVLSVAGSVAQLLYIPMVWIINAVGVLDIRLTLVATVVVFAPLAVLTAKKIAQYEQL